MPENTTTVFSQILKIDVPHGLEADAKTRRAPVCSIAFETDGPVPFPQIILRGDGPERLFSKDDINETESKNGHFRYVVSVPEKTLSAGKWQVQVEGCRKPEWRSAGGGDWIKAFDQFEVAAPPRPKVSAQDATGVKIYIGIHKHMHQPYYNATDKHYWDGEKDGIFSTRQGPYQSFVPMAIRNYINGGLDNAGLSVSWSGTLIEQQNWKYPGWADQLREIVKVNTTGGHARCALTAFGFYHPLMALIPARNIKKHIEMHARICKETFGVPPTKTLFPPETAFHVRMIPALREAGVEAVIYDSLHRYRACKEYPYAGSEEGMLPPNPADQVNPPVEDWTGLNNVWCPGKVSPSCLRPEWIVYTDPDGTEHKIIGIPAERYIGNEDARGGFGAL
ncbi:MAG: glycosyl hydrolase family 57, partial [Opitutales bacterium]